MRRRNPELHKKKLLEALEKSLGIITSACKEVGISRKQFYVYYNTDLDFKKAVDDIQDITIDFVENQLLKKIREGDTTATIFYLKTKAKSRGYIEKQQIEHNIEQIVIKPYEDTKGNTGS